MIQFYHTSSGTYNDSSIVTPQESLVFDTFNQRIRLMETYDLYFMRLTADYSHDTVDSSKFALSQHGAYELYDYVNTLDTSVCNAIDTANSSITSLKTLTNNLNSSINAVNTSVNTKFVTVDSSMLQIWQMYYEMQVVQAAAWNQLRALNPSLNMPNASVYQ